MAAYRRVDDIRSPAGWLPVHRDQLRAQRSVSSTSMGKPFSFLVYFTWLYSTWLDFCLTLLYFTWLLLDFAWHRVYSSQHESLPVLTVITCDTYCTAGYVWHVERGTSYHAPSLARPHTQDTSPHSRHCTHIGTLASRPSAVPNVSTDTIPYCCSYCRPCSAERRLTKIPSPWHHLGQVQRSKFKVMAGECVHCRRPLSIGTTSLLS